MVILSYRPKGVDIMGRMLGAFADNDELDRPDLNKCPDCKCFFSKDACPICGKICPENMRAGNRAPEKRKKKKERSNSDEYFFMEWYYSWWFIAIMMFFIPVVGIILFIRSPYKLSTKIVVVTFAILYMIVSVFGLGTLFSEISDLWDDPVDDSLTREEYVSRCETVSVEDICRSSDGYEDKFVSVRLKIISTVTYQDKFGTDKDYVCYLCEDESGKEFNILLRDCLLEDGQKFIAGDVVTVYGEGAGECMAHSYTYSYTEPIQYLEWNLPCINMAYAERNT